ncbi:hypothetical protein ACH9DO_15080 [Kocuria sp. M1N1S27]|uniref:hypothetical protein n=1 Tax=Kocuria kalidii TaxID=3376283 RepID=UPI0037A7B24C
MGEISPTSSQRRLLSQILLHSGPLAPVLQEQFDSLVITEARDCGCFDFTVAPTTARLPDTTECPLWFHAVSDTSHAEALGVYLWHEHGHAGGVAITWANADHHRSLDDLRIEEP